MPKHPEYPIALKRAAVARVAAGESIAEASAGIPRSATAPRCVR